MSRLQKILQARDAYNECHDRSVTSAAITRRGHGVDEEEKELIVLRKVGSGAPGGPPRNRQRAAGASAPTL